MKELAYYSIVRFLPFVETEEFANVGVVLLCPKRNYFGFQLAHRRARVTNFFESLDSDVYRAALDNLRQELTRIKMQMAGRPPEAAENLFMHLTEPRESLLRFGSMRAALVDDAEEALAEKFSYFVEHSFAGKEYQERLLVTAVRGVLRSERLQQNFQPETVGSEEFRLHLPMVHVVDDAAAAAIKPLVLNDAEPTRIYDKGAHWASKLRLLREFGGFEGDLMFAVQAPASGSATRRAFEAASEELRDVGAIVVAVTDRAALLDFARTH